MFHFCTLAKALGDENRVRILMALRHGPLCVCQLTAFLDLAPSTTSKHLSTLRQCQLIECVKDGRWVYYQLPSTPATEPVGAALNWVQQSLAASPVMKADAERLQALLAAEQEAALDTPCTHSLQAHLLDEGFVPPAKNTEKGHDI